mgnify:FL=1
MPPSNPNKPSDVANFHAWFQSLKDGEDRVRAHAFLPPRAGQKSSEAEEDAWLSGLNMTPWEHQAEAWRQLDAGRSVVIATDTASGKSLIYQRKMLEALAQGFTSLAVFPTKALAEDQLRSLRELATRTGIDNPEQLIVRYDGDTPRAERQALRREARVVITNPDMLHRSLLPFHSYWAPFHTSLKWVVIDELHAYRGVFGTHVANVLRRLDRVAKLYGSEPQFIAASATVANPSELFEHLVGRTPAAVEANTAPRGAKEVLFWTPPARPGNPERRRSPVAEAARLAAALVQAQQKVLVFCNSRRAAELVLRYARPLLPEDKQDVLASYRSGYTASERRQIEADFRAGRLQAVASTSALELGVDIGDVDVVVQVGYPGSMMAFWQRAGRAGRSGSRSAVVWIPGDDPLDEHVLGHPEFLLDGSMERAVADPHNAIVHARHVRCAASEHPVEDHEAWLSPAIDLAAVEGLRALPTGAYGATERYPHRHVSLRGRGGTQVRIRLAGSAKPLGTMEAGRAVKELHPGAVYLHKGEPYLVVELDLGEGRAVLIPHIEDFYTQVRTETHIDLIDHEPRLVDAELGLIAGYVRVTHEVVGYVRKRYRTEVVLSEHALDLPNDSFITQATWWAVTPEQQTLALPPGVFASGMHALEHTMIGLLPLFVLCERDDVGGVSFPVHPERGEPLIVIYDGAEGGVGYAEAGAWQFGAWLREALRRLTECGCADGCPRCTLSPKCGNGNQYLDKEAARRLAAQLLTRAGGATGESHPRA